MIRAIVSAWDRMASMMRSATTPPATSRWYFSMASRSRRARTAYSSRFPGTARYPAIFEVRPHLVGHDAAAGIEISQPFVGRLDGIFAVFESVADHEFQHFVWRV